MNTIDEIKIYGDEDGFHVNVYADDGDLYPFRIGLPDQFLAETKRTIGAWLAEGESARASYITSDPIRVRIAPDCDETGYALDDPKSEGFYDRMADAHDNREGK